jgi:uncharacterized membrane protein
MHVGSLKRQLMMALIGLLVIAAAISVSLARTEKAEAGVVGFCGNVLLGPMNGSGGQSWCYTGSGSVVATYQAYAWEEHSVCVNIPPWTVTACSSGTNGVYSGQLPPGNELGTPNIWNNTNTTQYASGVYFTR